MLSENDLSDADSYESSFTSDDDDDDDDGTMNTDGSTFTAIPPGITYFNPINYFHEKPGPRHVPPSDANPIEYFNLFFTPSFLQTIVNETNKFAQKFIGSNDLSAHSRAKKWTPTYALEIKAMIAVLLEMGITRRPTINSYWKQDSRKIPWFSKMFTRDRFLLLLRFFHLIDDESVMAASGHSNYDPCTRFDILVKHANTVFMQHYVPNQQLSINETLVGTHCHSIMKQNSNKKHKCQIKFRMLCDSITKYCLGFFCFKSVKYINNNNQTIKRNGMKYASVEKLLSKGNYLNKGYHLYTDNYFTSFKFAKSLLLRKTYLTGIIHRNRKEIPEEAKKINDVGVAKYFENQNILMCSYRDKKSSTHPIILISSNANSYNVVIEKKRGTNTFSIEKPSIIDEYNRYMAKIDESDRMLYANLDERRTCKYWNKIVFNIFGRMVMNLFIIYTLNNTAKKLSRPQFTAEIIEQIEQEWLQHRNIKPTTVVSCIQNGLEKLPGRNLRQCVVCSNKQSGIKRSNLICARCKKGLHGLCAGKHKC